MSAFMIAQNTVQRSTEQLQFCTTKSQHFWSHTFKKFCVCVV